MNSYTSDRNHIMHSCRKKWLPIILIAALYMNSISGSQRRKKNQGIPRQPCVSRRKRGCPTAGSPLISFSCVPHISLFIIMRNTYIRLAPFFCRPSLYVISVTGICYTMTKFCLRDSITSNEKTISLYFYIIHHGGRM